MRRYFAPLAAAVVLGSVVPSFASGQGGLDRLTIHGYLTQGYGRSSDLPIHGIPTDGTTDYRSAALQFRYGFSETDNLMLQLSHRRMGTSALSDVDSDVFVDWVFFQKRFAGFTAKVGRLPMPRGLYNEVRDVGVILPFYRAPTSVYAEGIETVDGVALSRTFFPTSPWSVTATAYGGGFNIVWNQATEDGQFVYQQRVEESVGGQLWFSTPVSGLRWGVSAQGWGLADSTTGILLQGSVEADFGRVVLRGEGMRVDVENSTEIEAFFVQAGLRVLEQLELNGQYELMDITQLAVPVPGGISMDYIRDVAVGVNYGFAANIRFKLEGHRVRGVGFDTMVDPVAPPSSEYVLGSISVSF